MSAADKPATSFTSAELRRMSEQLGDSEFEMALAPYNNYTGGTPAAKAEYEGLYPGAGTMTLGGQYAPPGMTSAQLDKGEKGYWNPVTERKEWLRGIPDTVQAVTTGAVPATWQHEFNHRNNPDRSESRNRFVDAVIAPDKRAWENAVDLQVDLYRRRGNDTPRHEIEKRLLQRVSEEHRLSTPKFTAKEVYEEEIARGGHVPESMRENKWFGEYDDTDKLQDYSKMRQKQTYWSTALREWKDRDAAAKAEE